MQPAPGRSRSTKATQWWCSSAAGQGNRVMVGQEQAWWRWSCRALQAVIAHQTCTITERHTVRSEVNICPPLQGQMLRGERHHSAVRRGEDATAGAWQLHHAACMGVADSGRGATLCALSGNRSKCVSTITAATWASKPSKATHPDGADAEVAHVCIQRLSTCSQ